MRARRAGYVQLGGDSFWITVRTDSQAAPPGLPPPGVYPFSPGQSALDTPLWTAAGRVTGVAVTGECTHGGSLQPPGGSGTLTLDAVGPDVVTGSFDVVDAQGGTHSGTFSAPLCTATDGRCCAGGI